MKKTVFALGLVLVLLAALPAAAGEKGQLERVDRRRQLRRKTGG